MITLDEIDNLKEDQYLYFVEIVYDNHGIDVLDVHFNTRYIVAKDKIFNVHRGISIKQHNEHVEDYELAIEFVKYNELKFLHYGKKSIEDVFLRKKDAEVVAKKRNEEGKKQLLEELFEAQQEAIEKFDYQISLIKKKTFSIKPPEHFFEWI